MSYNQKQEAENVSNYLQFHKKESMNCKLLHDNLIGYLDNTVSGDLRHQMDDHLKTCIHCQNIFQEVKLTYDSWNVSTEPEVNPFFYTRLEQKIKNKLEHQTAAPALVWRFRTLMATGLMIISVGLGIFIGKNISLQNTTSSPGREEVLQTYASDYYLSSANDDNVYSLTMNE